MDVPTLTASAAILGMAYHLMRAPNADDAAKTLKADWHQCQEKYCAPMYQIQVDKPVNTVLRNDALGGPTLKGTYQYVKSQYQREASESPGVNLVAHTIV